MPRPPAPLPGEATTRERILDVALDLFNANGYDQTSLREIAEQVGVTKAALYYHFPSKDDILLALHLRLHALGKESFGDLASADTAPAQWPGLLDVFIDRMLDNRSLFLLHARNEDALRKLQHHEGHEADHEDLEQQLRALMADPDIPLEQRARLTFAFGAIMSGLLMAGEVFTDVDTAELQRLIKGAVADLLDPITH